MLGLQQVVLQCPRQHFVLTHCQPPGARSPQRSAAPSEFFAGGYGPRMLQLWDEECIPPWLHTCPIGYRRRPSLPTALRFDALV